MTRVLVVWEDLFHEQLDRCLRRALRHLGLPSPDLYFDTCRGNTRFPPYLERDWPKAAHHGLPKSRGPIDYLVCVADADRAQDCAPIPSHTREAASTTAWLARADEAWTGTLRKAAPLGAERVFGRFLRWNKESLLVAAHDVDEVLQHLQCRDRAAVNAYLRDCAPSPLATPDAAFVEHFRRPGGCLDAMLKAAGAPPLKKGAPPLESALGEASQRAIDRLCARVPDLVTLAEAISRLPVPTAS
jgi:hypothetical protein